MVMDTFLSRCHNKKHKFLRAKSKVEEHDPLTSSDHSNSESATLFILQVLVRSTSRVTHLKLNSS